MSIITISSGSCTQSKKIAKIVAEKIGYDFVSGDMVLESSNQLNIPEAELIKELHASFSILKSIETGNGKYIKEINNVLLNQLMRNNVVYFGVVSQAFLLGVPHALNVRIVADPTERAKIISENKDISMQKALQLLTEKEEELRRWSHELYGIDIWESKYYDMVLKTGVLTIDCIVDLIINFVKQPSFRRTAEFQERIHQLRLKTGTGK